MKNILLVAGLLVSSLILAQTVGPPPLAPEVKKLLEDGEKLFSAGKHDDALRMLSEGMEKYPQSRLQLLSVRMNAYEHLGRWAEAAADAIEKDRLDHKKTSVFALEVAYDYMKLGDLDNAFRWLDVSAERGFQNYYVFDKVDDYKPLRGDPRLAALVKRFKINAGIGQPVKPFSRRDLNGREISPASFRGKVLLIDFWATWCGPCVKEIPGLKKCYDDLHGRGFEVIGISLDQDRVKLETFVRENQIQWPVTCSFKGFWDDDVRALYGVQLIPSVWLVDKKGNLRHLGLRGEALQMAVAEMLNE